MSTRAVQLPELVYDSKLPTRFEPNLVTHNKPSGRRTSQRKEIWRQETMLGHGGNGVIWLQRRTSGSSATPELRAVKQIRNDANAGWKYYWRELEALAKFSQDKYSDFFVQSYGWYEDSMYLYVAMEYCEYGDLGAYLKDKGTLPEDQAQYLAAQVLGGLSMMHAAGFAHRDIKPANILIKNKPPDDWWVKICDLGLSKRTEHAVGSTTVRATPGFMPPEIIGFHSSPETSNPLSSDMWCYGETVFHMLVGRGTFGNLSKLQRYCEGKEKFPAEGLDTSETAVDFVQSLMAANSSQRLTATEAQTHSWMAPSVSQFETLREPAPFVRGEEDTRPAHLPVASEWTQPSAAWSDTESGQDELQEATRPVENDQTANISSPRENSGNRGPEKDEKGDASKRSDHQVPQVEFETESVLEEDDSDDSYSTRPKNNNLPPPQVETPPPAASTSSLLRPPASGNHSESDDLGDNRPISSKRSKSKRPSREVLVDPDVTSMTNPATFIADNNAKASRSSKSRRGYSDETRRKGPWREVVFDPDIISLPGSLMPIADENTQSYRLGKSRQASFSQNLSRKHSREVLVDPDPYYMPEPTAESLPQTGTASVDDYMRPIPSRTRATTFAGYTKDSRGRDRSRLQPKTEESESDDAYQSQNMEDRNVRRHRGPSDYVSKRIASIRHTSRDAYQRSLDAENDPYAFPRYSATGGQYITIPTQTADPSPWLEIMPPNDGHPGPGSSGVGDVEGPWASALAPFLKTDGYEDAAYGQSTQNPYRSSGVKTGKAYNYEDISYVNHLKPTQDPHQASKAKHSKGRNGR